MEGKYLIKYVDGSVGGEQCDPRKVAKARKNGRKSERSQKQVPQHLVVHCKDFYPRIEKNLRTSKRDKS